MIYLASPYNDPDPAVREKRFEAACEAAAALFRRGFLVFSPIAETHPIAKHGVPLDWEFWQSYDREHIGHCSQVWVLTLDGWKESQGVQAEIAIARELGKPIIYWAGPGNLGTETPDA